MLKVILDTNVLLSGLFFNGNERKVLEFFLQGKIEVILPQHVLIEAKNVIHRKSKNFGVLFVKSIAMFELVVSRAKIVPVSEYKKNFSQAKQMIRDEMDAPILVAVLSIEHDYFLSGDKDFIALSLKTHISSKELIEKIKD